MAVNGSGRGGGSGGGSGGGGKGIRAGRAYVELSADDAGLRGALAKARAMVMKFGKGLAGVGGGLLGAGGGILGALGLGTKSLLDRAGELGKLSEKLGVPVEQLSAFAYAAETTGQSLEDLSGHFENLAERVAQGANGAGEAAETFKKLGIDANALKLKNPVDQLIAIADAMGSVTNETERLGMLSSLGGDQFQNLNALFKKGPGGIAALMQEAKDVGASMNNETAAGSQRASQAFHRSWAAIKSSIFSVGEALIPHTDAIEEAARFIVGIAKSVREFISENKILVTTITAVSAAILVGGVAFVAIGSGLALAATAAGGFAAVIGLLLSPVGAIAAAIGVFVAGIAAATYAFVRFTETGRGLFEGMKIFFGDIWETAKTTFGGIADAVKGGDMALAWDIGTKGLTVVWKTFITSIVAAWNKYLNYFTSSTKAAFEKVSEYLPSFGGFDEWFKGLGGSAEDTIKRNLEGDLAGFQAARDQAKRELNDLAGKARAGVAVAKPVAADGRSTSQMIARFLGSARGTFSAPNYKQFFGATGIEQKQLEAQLRTANAIEVLKNKAGPLVFQ